MTLSTVWLSFQRGNRYGYATHHQEVSAQVSPPGHTSRYGHVLQLPFSWFLLW